MSWKDILKDVKSELKEMFKDEKVIERFDAVGDAEKELVESLMLMAAKYPNREKTFRQSIYMTLGLDPYKEYPETKSAAEYLEDKDKELLALEKLYQEYEEKGREILEKIWEIDFIGDTKTVDVHVRWLREKLEEDPSAPKFLKTVRDFGYKFG